MIIEFDEQCPDCRGTGLYRGMAERNGAAVVCHTCKGTGCHHFKRTYTEFTGRQRRSDVSRVFEANPGICLGTGSGHVLSDFGGMPYGDWDDGKPFPPKSENRRFTCPAWWYQNADYKKKPDWPECDFGRFTSCRRFPNKAACWAKWDKENT